MEIDGSKVLYFHQQESISLTYSPFLSLFLSIALTFVVCKERESERARERESERARERESERARERESERARLVGSLKL